MNAEVFNAEQRRAVEHGEGPLLIVAGPGTGKTKTLTARIAHLVEQNLAKPQEILALTFTNKAAEEMQTRVGARLGTGQKPVIATFHALAHLLLTLPDDLELISDIERAAVLQSLKQDKAGQDFNVRDMGLIISRAKNQPGGKSEPGVQALLDAYNAELRIRKLYDYDDLLVWLHEALEEPNFRHTSQRFTHILVDEFQDTNDLQYELIRQLNRTNNLFVIGDPLQSIYGFRGARAEIFDRFSEDFLQAARITLLTNYRSAPQIVQLAAAIFPDAVPLKAHRTEPGIAETVEVLNEYGEADWVVNEIERQVGGSDMLRSSQHHATAAQRTFSDFAIMYRIHAVAKSLQAALEKAGIPYQVVGEGSPYLQPHATLIIQAFAYLVGLMEPPTVKGATASQVAKLLDPLKPNAHQLPLTQLAHRIITTLNVVHEKNRGAVHQFTNALVRYDNMPPAEYVAHVQKLAEQEYYDPAAGAVTLLTIHAAKGLEFPVVFLASAEEGTLPFARHGTIADIEEEKRLFYVAVTRARDELYMLHARKRRREPRQVSSFITVLPKGVVASVVDPGMAAQQRQIRRRAQKRAQGSLF